MSEIVPLAVIGAGIIGNTHIATLARCDRAALCAIVDPHPDAAILAARHHVPHFRDIEELIGSNIAKGAIVASPNATHVPLGEKLLRSEVPVLLEKPVANTLSEGLVLENAARNSKAPLLVGHHRRHNPIVKTARKMISEGALGQLVTANVNVTLTKPSPYFETPWRVQNGQGGPLLINLIHEVDLLRHFFGEVKAVTAQCSNSRRGLAVEDTAIAILEFTDGGMASCTITDAGCGPWAWDVSAGENLERFPAHNVTAHTYSGTKAGLSLPDLVFWRHPGTPDWTKEMTRQLISCEPVDPYDAQLAHFIDLIEGKAVPLVSCRGGLRNMQIIEAIKNSASQNRRIELDEIFLDQTHRQ